MSTGFTQQELCCFSARWIAASPRTLFSFGKNKRRKEHRHAGRPLFLLQVTGVSHQKPADPAWRSEWPASQLVVWNTGNSLTCHTGFIFSIWVHWQKEKSHLWRFSETFNKQDTYSAWCVYYPSRPALIQLSVNTQSQSHTFFHTQSWNVNDNRNPLSLHPLVPSFSM